MDDSKNPPAARIEQCLFGYDSGHRRLATSLKFPGEVESKLLRLSDLAPGANELDEEGYWTGVPLPSVKYYALLRTWAALEMPRPGSVWTHALLIKFSDIARFSNLSVLKELVKRPSPQQDFGGYTLPLLVDNSKLDNLVTASVDDVPPLIRESGHSLNSDHQKILWIVRLLYGSSGHVCVFSEPGEMDDSIFRIWTQQWPSLRRAFSFRTTGKSEEKMPLGVSFDLRVLPITDRGFKPAESVDSIVNPVIGEAEAVHDAMSPTPTEFRRFIWRYGADLTLGREKFSFLSNLFVATHKGHMIEHSYEELLTRVADFLPDVNEGKALKNDLINGSQNSFSLMPAMDAFKVVQYFVLHPKVGGLPKPSEKTLESLALQWSERSNDIVVLVQNALEVGSEIGESLLLHLFSTEEPTALLATVRTFPLVRYGLVRLSPTLLTHIDLLSIDQPELLELLKLLPSDDSLAAQTISKLVRLDDEELVNLLFSRFPNLVVKGVVEALELSAGKVEVAAAWLGILRKLGSTFMTQGYVENSKSLNALSVYAEVLGYSNNEVLDLGPLPWSYALPHANDDISIDRKNKFFSFLLKLALSKPVRGCEIVFEYVFTQIYQVMNRNKLSADALEQFEHLLPNLEWWKQWDKCYRLRLALLYCYIDNDLDHESFYRIFTHSLFSKDLEWMARKRMGGQRYLAKK